MTGGLTPAMSTPIEPPAGTDHSSPRCHNIWAEETRPVVKGHDLAGGFVKKLAIPLVAMLTLAACANSSDGSEEEKGSAAVTDLPAVSTLDVPADALKPAGDGKAKCDPSTTIGYVGAMTGPNAQLGINIYQGAQTAITEHNEANPACQVKFKKFDTEGDPNKATGPTTQAVNEQDIVGIVGLPFSGESKATGKILEDAGLVHITPSATNPDLSTNGWKTFFRGMGNDNVQGPAAARLAKKIGAKTAYVVRDDSDYGIGLANATEKAFGDRVVGTDKVTTGQKDFSATISKILNAKPDVVFYAGYYSEGAAFDQQLVGKGFKGPLMGPDGLKDDQFVKLAGDASSNGYFTCPCLPGELIPEFAKSYAKAAKGGSPGTYSIEGYDAAAILLKGLDSGQTTRPQLFDFVTKYTGQGFSKKFEWDGTGELTETPVFGYKVQDGKIVSVGTID